jgi:ABC-type transport system involved in cytochrome bd biosynthesis fused ATPase/permease subunit
MAGRAVVLVTHEAVMALPAAAVQRGQTCAAARRITGILDEPDPMPELAHPAPAPETPVTVRSQGARLRYEPDGPSAFDGVDLDLTPGGVSRSSDSAARARALLPPYCCDSATSMTAPPR